MPHLPEPITRGYDLATVAAAISRATPTKAQRIASALND